MESYSAEAVNRLKKIEGQIGGLEKMFNQDRYCVDILTQISAVQEALRGLSKLVMKNFLETCATNAIRSKSKLKAEKVYQELMDVIYKYAK